MSDLHSNPANVPAEPEDDYATWEVVLWLVGIISIPLVPILMVVLFSPWSGL